jgi:hypothetical protein
MHHLVYHLFNIKVGNFNLMPIITIFFNYCHELTIASFQLLRHYNLVGFLIRVKRIEQLYSEINSTVFIYLILFYTIHSLLKLKFILADLYLMICFLITLYFIPDSSHKFLFSYEYYDCFLKNHNLNHTKEDFIYLTLSLKNF